MFWKKDNNEKKINQMNYLLKKSFENVKRDTTGIFQWMNYFYRRGMEQEQLIKRLQLELSYMPKTREDIRRIIDDYYSFESIMSKISELNYKIDELARKHAVQAGRPERDVAQPVHREMHPDISYIEKRLEMLEQKKMSIKEKIMRKLTRNSKEYIKSVIISYIRNYEKISALQLKEIVVDEQNFCSKSSFYRLLEEIEDLDEIGVIKQGKEKHYISKAVKRI
jgi:hypothetical protein